MQTFLNNCSFKRELLSNKILEKNDNIMKLSDGCSGKFYKIIKVLDNNRNSIFSDKISYLSVIKLLNVSYKRNYLLVDNGERLLNLPKIFAKDILVVSL